MKQASENNAWQGSSEPTTDMLQFLTFTVGREEYGIDIMTVKEIKGWSEVTRLPNSPEFMRGVMNLRGLIIPIFDLRTRFGMGITEANEKNVVIILSAGERIIGILVDTVSDILDSTSEDIKPSPAVENDVKDEFVNGIISVGERMVVLLDVRRLFDSEMLAHVIDGAA